MNSNWTRYGLSNEEVIISRKKYGTNEIIKPKTKTFLKMLIESLGDPIIKILLIALAIKVVFLFKDANYFETIGIVIAILLASFISTISEYGSEQAFKSLQDDTSKIKSRVIRNHEVIELFIDDIVVGDVVLLSSGDKIPADGSLMSGNIFVDESLLSGETKEKEKSIIKDNKLFRGTTVFDGEGLLKVEKIGNSTMYGDIAQKLGKCQAESPLKIRLRELAKIISKIGYIGAVLVVISYLFSVIVIANDFELVKIMETLSNTKLMVGHILYSLTLSVTIIVVSVPEGLPMMITLVLSSNMKKMLKSNVLVRKMVGIETSGSMNILFTDKTGTLTKGKLEVIGIVNYEGKTFKNLNDIKCNKMLKYFKNSLLYNNACNYNGTFVGGNSTDKALMNFIKLKKEKTVQNEVPFNSKNKYSIVSLENISYIKGAPEVILNHCNHYYDSLGNKKILNQKKIKELIDKKTDLGNRVILLAINDKMNLNPLNNLTFLGIVLIKDEVRDNAIEGVNLIKSAGINIVMITGDAKNTALSIAKETAIITNTDDIVLDSKDFNNMSDEEIKKILIRIKVISRALPSDKLRLVNLAQELNLVVGMTGDGVNDAPALKSADVGFAMGSGTEVAKDASDIVILDDNILSISNAIMYGRTTFKSIRKFIIYQLTCNMCALILSIIGPFIGINTPITIIQMLWINMIMDTFAGLAFSFEPPLKEYMKEIPKNKNESIMNKYMYSEILITGLYSALLCLFFLKLPWFTNMIRNDINNKYLMTAYFALFIFLGIANAFNSRTTRINIFANLKNNKVFIITFGFILIIQIYLIYFGSELFRTYGLNIKELLTSILLATTVIPIDMIRKKILKIKII